MIKIECEVSDLQALFDKHAEMQAEVERQQECARQAWNERDNLLETVSQLRRDVANQLRDNDWLRVENDNLKDKVKVNPPQLDQLPTGAHVYWQTIQWTKDLIRAVLDHRKIGAIKAVRALCGPPSGGSLGLKEAKDLVEEFYPFKNPPYQDSVPGIRGGEDD
jgi:hypothetical protein